MLIAKYYLITSLSSARCIAVRVIGSNQLSSEMHFLSFSISIPGTTDGTRKLFFFFMQIGEMWNSSNDNLKEHQQHHHQSSSLAIIKRLFISVQLSPAISFLKAFCDMSEHTFIHIINYRSSVVRLKGAGRERKLIDCRHIRLQFRCCCK